MALDPGVRGVVLELLTTSGSGPVGAVAIALGALVLLRLAVVSTLTRLAVVPGQVGRAAARAARAVRPGIVRRLVAATLGLGIPAVALAAPAGAAPAPHAAASPAAPNGSAAAAQAPRFYVVRHGDSLWTIARAHVPAGAGDAQIARAWPRWHAANREEIGPDPSLLHPGTRLRVPDRRSTGTSTPQLRRPSPAAPTSRAWAQFLDPDRR